MTHATPTRSRHPERAALLACALLVATGASAHGVVADAIPNEAGARVGASLALSWLNADAVIPMATLPGVLTTGNRTEDRDGFSLEHAVIDAGVRLNDLVGATLAVGWHGTDAAHIEAAWVEIGRPALSVGVGRNRVPLGPVFTPAGHMDRFAFMPLAKQAAFEGDWIEDGVNLRWRDDGPAELEVNAGIWRGKVFPGVTGSSAAPALHVGGYLGAFRLDGFLTHLQPDRRGTAIALTSDGHTHATPSCAQSLAGLACFEGDSDIAGASLRWHAATLPIEVTVAGLLRREEGNLFSSNGDTAYQGETRAGWVEAAWTLRPAWQLLLRSERLVAEHDLSGFGASLVAHDAALLPEPGATSRHALALVWQPRQDLTVSAELGREEVAGEANPYIGLRLLWSGDWRYRR